MQARRSARKNSSWQSILCRFFGDRRRCGGFACQVHSFSCGKDGATCGNNRSKAGKTKRHGHVIIVGLAAAAVEVSLVPESGAAGIADKVLQILWAPSAPSSPATQSRANTAACRNET